MKSSKVKRVTRSAKILINSGLNKVFPLFTPEGEKKWAKGWDFEPIFPQPFQTCENSIFRTGSHDHNVEPALWIINTYNTKKHYIEYIRIEPSVKLGQIKVNCSQMDSKDTEVQVRYTYTALSDEGNIFIENFTENKYLEYIGDWELAINHYLKTGKVLNK
jgi:hypothetical protein